LTKRTTAPKEGEWRRSEGSNHQCDGQHGTDLVGKGGGARSRILGAEFLVCVGDISAFESADRLAAYAGLVPAARDSGKRVGNHRRMRGGNKTLKRVFYRSAFASLRGSPESRTFYDRKRAEGKRQTQALIALARRRVNVVWSMLRDGTTYETRSAA
jgi:transposase